MYPSFKEETGSQFWDPERVTIDRAGGWL